MSAETINIPEPIIDPQTIIVESNRPRPLTSSGCFVSDVTAACDCSGMNLASSLLLRNLQSAPRDLEILGSPSPRVRRAPQITDNRHRVRARAKNFSGGLYCDAPNRHKRFSS